MIKKNVKIEISEKWFNYFVFETTCLVVSKEDSELILEKLIIHKLFGKYLELSDRKTIKLTLDIIQSIALARILSKDPEPLSQTYKNEILEQLNTLNNLTN
jgi:hypothetical protein